MAFCHNCGSEIEPGSKFCANCGTPVADEKQTNLANEAESKEASNKVAEVANEAANEATNEVVEEATEVAEEVANEIKNEEVAKTLEATAAPSDNMMNAQMQNGGFPQPMMNSNEGGFPQPMMNSNEGGFPQPMMNSGEGGFPQPMVPPTPKKPVNKKKVGIIVGIIAAVLVAIIATVTVVLVIDSNNKKKAEEERKKVNINDYIVTEFTGYDSLGEGTIKFDKGLISAIAYSLGADLQKDDKGKFTYDESSAEVSSAANEKKFIRARELYYTMQISLEKYDELKNGDKIKVTFAYDEKLANQLSLNIIYKDKKIEVKGLEKVTEVDPFSEENCIIEQSGMDGYATVSVKAASQDSDTWGAYMGYEYKGWGHSTGDVVKITINESTVRYILQKCGVKLTKTEYEYTVKETDHYIKEASEISEKVVEAINEKAKEDITEECSSDLIYTIENTEYVGAYMMTTESDGNTSYFVYKLSMKLKNDKEFDAYAAICVYNILQCSDGTQSYNEYTSVVYNSFENADEDTIKAFESEEKIYEFIFDRFTNQTITKTEGLKDYEVKLTEDDTKTIEDKVDELFTALNKKEVKTVRTLTMTKLFEKEYYKDWTNREITLSITDKVNDFVDDGQFNSVEITSMRVYPASKTADILAYDKEHDRGNYNFEKIVCLEVNAEYHKKGSDGNCTYSYTIFAYEVNGKWFLSFFIDGSVNYIFQ